MALRRTVLIALLAVAAGAAQAAPTKSHAAKPRPKAGSTLSSDISLGSPKAKVEVVEYASLSCPHCARFNEQVFPAFKAKYVDTGQVRYTMRELLTPPAEVAAAGFLMARCAGPSKYYKVVDEVFRSQSQWQPDAPIKPILQQIALNNGLTAAQFESCLTDQKAMTALQKRVQASLDAGVNSTPTFFVNGKKVGEGEMTLEQLDAAIAAARNGGG
jgi:protein-disulfide isomerase